MQMIINKQKKSLNLSKNKIAEQVPMNSLFSTLTAKIKEKSFTL